MRNTVADSRRGSDAADCERNHDAVASPASAGSRAGVEPRPLKGRFAPSPTGRMHAGNIFAALMSWIIVKSQGGTIVLRIEDLDRERSKQKWIDQVQRDFEMLGLFWDEGPYYQHDRDEAYRTAFERLEEAGEVYPCFCTRADLHSASAPHRGEKAVYAGTCRSLAKADVARRMAERNPAWRIVVPSEEFALDDLVQGHYGQNLARDCGDFVIRRSDGLFAYQLAVVVDDAEQGVNCVVRGMDLLVSTPQQMFLQSMLGFPPVTYAHVPLFVSSFGRRLSKRDKDAGLEELMARYRTPGGVLGHVAYCAGLLDADEPLSCDELMRVIDVSQMASRFPDAVQILWQ